MALPPQHRIDAPMVFISLYDTCWDDSALEEHRLAAGDGASDFGKWSVGLTRYDPKTLPDGLMEPGALPTRFYLRRLSLAEWATVKDMEDKGSSYARFLAFQLGVRHADNIDVPGLQWPGDDERRRLTDADMKRVEAVIRRDFISDVGLAVIRANRDLGLAEKKPSAS